MCVQMRCPNSTVPCTTARIRFLANSSGARTTSHSTAPTALIFSQTARPVGPKEMTKASAMSSAILPRTALVKFHRSEKNCPNERRRLAIGEVISKSSQAWLKVRFTLSHEMS